MTPSALYTGLAVEDITDIALQNPDKTFCRYDRSIFPFRDRAFDWVFSNAVIEYVGGRESQLLFLRKMRRVSRRVFFTMPNKYFPVESHTNVILRHRSSKGFYQWCRDNKPAMELAKPLPDERQLLAAAVGGGGRGTL